MTIETGADANQQAVAFLDYYCDQATRADYAVLIDGPWGSGKTRFIVDYLKKHDTAQQRRDPLQPNAIYVSLFGLRTSADVKAALFAAAHAYLSSGASRFLGVVAAGVIDKFTGIKNLDPGDYIKIDASVIVFDDLERTGLEPADVLGIVNSFVDSARGAPCKVIVIGNQAEIDETDAYLRQKEKVIGRTLRVAPNAAAAVEGFIGELRSARARDQARQSQDAVLQIFHAWGRGNLRSLRHTLADFDRLVAVTEELLKDNARALNALLLLTLAVGLEVRAGSRFDMGEDGPSSAFEQATLGGPAAERAREIMERYPEVRWRDPIVSEFHIEMLAASGRIDVTSVLENLAFHPLVAGPQATPYWRQLWSWADLGQSDYATAKAGFLAALDAGEYRKPSEILHAAGVILDLAEYGERLFDDPVAWMSSYVDRLAGDGALITEMGVLDPHDDSAWGLAYHQRQTPEFALIRAHLQAAVRKLYDQLMKGVAADVLAAALAGKSISTELLGDVDFGGGYDGVAFLHHTDPAKFADALLLGGRLNRTLISNLASRYKGATHYPALLAEREWLGDLADEMARRATAAPPPFGRSWSITVDFWFKPMNESLKKAAEQLAAAAADEPASVGPNSA